MQRDAPLVVKGIRVRAFVVGCNLSASRLGKVAGKHIEVCEPETKDFESNFE